MQTAQYLIKRALLSEEDAKMLSKSLPTWRKKKVRKGDEGFRREIRTALKGRKLSPADASILADYRHRFWGPTIAFGWPAAAAQANRRKKLERLLLEEITASGGKPIKV